MRKVAFYFDFISPYSWLACSQLEGLEKRTKVEVEMFPILFASLLNTHKNLGPAEIPVKRTYTIIDAMRWAAHYGKSYQGPPAHPFNPLLPLRACTAIKENAGRKRFAIRVLNACWEEGLDISRPETLAGLATSEGFEAQALLAAAATPEIKQALRTQSGQAIQIGIFGVPTFIVDKELFWGNDRLLFLENYLKGEPPPDPRKVSEILGRPRAAER